MRTKISTELILLGKYLESFWPGTLSPGCCSSQWRPQSPSPPRPFPTNEACSVPADRRWDLEMFWVWIVEMKYIRNNVCKISSLWAMDENPCHFCWANDIQGCGYSLKCYVSYCWRFAQGSPPALVDLAPHGRKHSGAVTGKGLVSNLCISEVGSPYSRFKS